ncbi:RNA polymerase factor sigma-54 [bacterium]|nr:RNA polymerase factor sigma-54 [bacterium]
MSVGLKLSQKLTQNLVLTPELQQSIKLLQLGRMEYAQAIEEALLENPVLEEVPAAQNSKDLLEAYQRELREYSSWDRLETGVNADRFRGNKRKDFDDEGEDFSLNNVACPESGLIDHLLQQIRSEEFTTLEKQILEQLLANLNSDGYFEGDLETIAHECGAAPEEAHTLLEYLQDLDPPGIAARDLRECLLLQAIAYGHINDLVYRVVDVYLEDISNMDFAKIAALENTTAEAVEAALQAIRHFDPWPGRIFYEETPIYITPDVYVSKINGQCEITLNDTGIPQIRLSDSYQDLLKQVEQASPEEKLFLEQKIKSATWLIKSIQQRKKTLLRATESIMRFQNDFLDQGISALKPLVLKDVAQELSLHESTISRITTNKFVHTPHGVFELKYFFSSGLRSFGGDISSESVKEKIRTIIRAEAPANPYSDQDLVGILGQQGISVARRTVAKYREMMNILPSSKRKKNS